MCLSSETRAWGVINCGEGGRLSGAVILQMIPASNVEAGNGSMKRHTYTAPARLGHILLERNAWVDSYLYYLYELDFLHFVQPVSSPQRLE